MIKRTKHAAGGGGAFEDNVIRTSFVGHNKFLKTINSNKISTKDIRKLKAGTGIDEIDSIYAKYFKDKSRDGSFKKTLHDVDLQVRRGKLIEGLTLLDSTMAKKLQSEQPDIVKLFNELAEKKFPDADLVKRKVEMGELKNKLDVTDKDLDDAFNNPDGIETLRKNKPEVEKAIGKYDKAISAFYTGTKVGIVTAGLVGAGVFLKDYAVALSGCFMITKHETCKITELSCCSHGLRYNTTGCKPSDKFIGYKDGCVGYDENSSEDCCMGKCTYTELQHLNPDAVFECRKKSILEAIYMLVSGSLDKIFGKGLFGGLRGLILAIAIGGITFGGSYIVLRNNFNLDKKINVIISSCCGLLSFLIMYMYA